MSQPWCRLYAEFRNDPKVRTLTDSQQIQLVRLFCMNCEGPTDKLSLDELRYGLGTMEDETFHETRRVFLAKGFVDEKWALLNWNKRQFLSDSSTERVRKHRAKIELKQDETLHETGETQNVTDQNRTEQNRAEKKKKQKPLPKVKPSVDPRFGGFREDFEKAFSHSTGKPASWDGKEASQLSRWLKANPTISREEWRTILQHRAKSPVNKASPLSKWVGSALAWLNGPADEWGKEIPAAGKGRYGTREAKSDAAMRNLREALTGGGAADGGPHGDGDSAGRDSGAGLFADDGEPVIEGTLA